MKKYIKYICLILVVLLTAFCGCAADDDAPESAASITLSDVLAEKSSVEGTYTDDVGNCYNYSYHVPMLLIDSQDAQYINRNISGLLEHSIENELSTMDDGGSLIVYKCGYTAYLNENVLSVVLFIHTDFEYSEYYCFNIDVSTGKELSSEDLLRLRGVDSDEMLSLQKKTLENAFVSLYGSDDSFGEDDSFYNEIFSLTVDEDNLAEGCPMYFGPDKELRCIGRLYSFGGSDYYYYTLSADNANNPFVNEVQTVLD